MYGGQMTLRGETLTSEKKSRLRTFLANHEYFLQKHKEEDAQVFSKIKQVTAEMIVSKPLSELTFRHAETDDDHQILGFIEGRISSWDSEELGFKVAKLDHFYVRGERSQSDLTRNHLLSEFINWSRNKEIDCILARTSLGDHEAIAALEQFGFRTVNVLETFRRACQVGKADAVVDSEAVDFLIEGCRENDVDKVANLAGEIFRVDHFHNDVKIPVERSNRLHASWARNCCQGRSDQVLVAKDHNSVAGFITCNVVEPFQGFRYGVIELVGVSPKHRGIGLGRRLLDDSLEWFTTHRTQSVYVGTEAENYPAMNLYINGSFRVTLSEVTMHWWA